MHGRIDFKKWRVLQWMYENSYFTPSGLCQNKTTFHRYGEIISLALLCDVPHPFSAGPVLLMRPPCCEHGGNSAFAGHFFSTIPTKSAIKDRAGKFQFEKWQFGKKWCWRSDWTLLKCLVVLATQSEILRRSQWPDLLKVFSILVFPAGHPRLFKDSFESLCWGPSKGNV